MICFLEHRIIGHLLSEDKMKIVICKDCDGWGKNKIDVGTHNSDYELRKCKTCKGTGRMVQEVSISHKPFNTSSDEAYRSL